MPNYDFFCQKCQKMTVEFCKFNERDTIEILCQKCDTKLERRIAAPMVMKAAYPDGTKREGWADMLATAKLEEAKANLDWRSDDARQINKELDEREKKAK